MTRPTLLLLVLLALFATHPTVSSASSSETGLPARNPWTAEGPYPMSHHDPAQTDVSVVEGPTRSKDLILADTRTVPAIWCSSPIVKKVGNETSVIAATAHGLIKINATGERFELVSTTRYPGEEALYSEIGPETMMRSISRIDEKRRQRQDWRLLFHVGLMLWQNQFGLNNAASGVYGIIDRNGYHYTAYGRTRLVKSFDDNEAAAPLRTVAHIDIREALPDGSGETIEQILGLAMTYDGHLVAAATGALLVLDRDLLLKDHLLFPGEHVENSVAVDETSIYIVTSKSMRRVIWNGSKLSTSESDGAWESAYDVMPEGEAIAKGATSHGSGSTPTLMGFGEDEDKLVVISDGHPDGTQLVAFWREEIPDGFEQKPGTPSRRVADQIRIPLSLTTIEASPVVYDYGVLVGNSTFPDPAPWPLTALGNAFTGGITRTPPLGMQKFEWLPEEDVFRKAWLRPDIDNTDWAVPTVSPASRVAYVAHKREGNYEYLALDWDTGKTVATWKFPDDGIRWNTWGAMTTLLEDGDLLLGGFFGVKRFDIGDLR